MAPLHDGPAAPLTSARGALGAGRRQAALLPLSVIKDLFFVSTRGRSARRSLSYLGVVALVVFPLYGRSLAMHVTLIPDQHRWMSLDIALNKTFCGEPSALSPSFKSRTVLEHPLVVSTPFRRMIRAEAGSIDAYCRSLTPYVNNENSLMLLMRAALWARRGLSPRGLGHWLLLVRLVVILCFCYVLLWSGASVLTCACILAAALSLLQSVSERGYSVYPFLLVLPMASVALYSVASRVVVPPRVGAHLLFSAFGGGLAAFHANMRTSHLPMLLGLFLAYLAITHGAAGRLGSRLTRSQALAWWSGGVLAFAIGYAAFTVTFIRPLEAVASKVHAFANYSYHAVTHPLVLSLALPENDLSRREGIVWGDDGAGFRLAKEMVPTVKYLEPPYERALLLYYLKLWLFHPREMVDIYRMKIALAGKDMLDNVGRLPYGGRLWTWVLAPLGILPSGGALLSVFVLVTAVSAVFSMRMAWPLAFVMTLAGVAACMSLLESMVTVPYFLAAYHGYLLMSAVLVGLLAWQLLLEGSRAALLWIRQRQLRREAL